MAKISFGELLACSKINKDVKENALNKDMRGKSILIYGKNNTGKTKTAMSLPNALNLACENVGSAVKGYTAVVTSSRELNSFIDKIKLDKSFDDFLRDEPITLVVDGAENIAKYSSQKLCSQYGVKSIGEGKKGYGLWNEWDMDMWTTINKLMTSTQKRGITLIIICHEAMDKDGYTDILGEKRLVKILKNECDFVFKTIENGTDENNIVINSSASCNGTIDYFARSRYESGDGFIEDFNAENLQNFIEFCVEETGRIENRKVYDSFFDVYSKEDIEKEKQKDIFYLIDWLEIAQNNVFVGETELEDGFISSLYDYIKDESVQSLKDCKEVNIEALIDFKCNLANLFNGICKKNEITKDGVIRSVQQGTLEELVDSIYKENLN